VFATYQNKMIAGTYGGVFLSTDKGQTWKPLGLQGKSVTDIVFLDSTTFVSTDGNGIFRSFDLGKTWSPCINGFSFLYGPVLYITNLTTVGSTLLASVRDLSIWRSTDKGDSWIRSDSGVDNYSVDNLFTVGNVVLASAAGGSGSGMFRSTDAGITWARLDTNPYAWNAELMCQYGKTTYGIDYTNAAEVYISQDSGCTWSLPTGASAPDDIIYSVFADSSGLYAGTDAHGIFRSADRLGDGWMNVSNGIGNNTILSLSGIDRTLFAGTYAGIFTTTNSGGQWTLNNDGLTNCQVTAVVSASTGLMAGTWGGGIAISSDSGKTWHKAIVSPDPYILDLLDLNNAVYALVGGNPYNFYSGSTVYRSGNGGATWTTWPALAPYTIRSLTANNVYFFATTESGIFRCDLLGQSWVKVLDGYFPYVRAITTIGSTVIASYFGMLYRSPDNGTTWTSTNLGISNMVLKTVGSTIYAGNAEVNVIYASRDSGKTWTDLHVPLANADVEQISGNGAFVVAGLSKGAGVIASYDTGNTWQRYNCNLTNTDVRSLCIYNSMLFAGTWGNGIYRVTPDSVAPVSSTPVYPDSGATDVSTSVQLSWSAIVGAATYTVQISRSPMFDTLVVDSLVTTEPTCVVSGLWGKTTYYWRYSGTYQTGNQTDWLTSSFTTREIIPEVIRMYQNYPNPFNTSTVIRYDLPNPSFVRVRVYDILGRVVDFPITGYEVAGEHSISWNATRFASGIYFYTIEADGSRQTKKMLLLK
jgi:photosystem II stability/assembly factor-like uncharacterized protein